MLSLLFALAVSLARADEPRGRLHARVGAVYDSDILIAPDSMFDQGRPSRFGDYRLQTAAELGYAVIARGRHRWTPAGAADLTNTARAAHAAGDPYRFALAAPYAYEGNAYRLVVRPTFQSLMMDPTLSTVKTVVQESEFIDVETTWRTAGAWSTGVSAQYRRDVSGLRDSVGPDDADANKYSLHASETFRPAGPRPVRLDLGYVANQAAGRRRRYGRAQASLGVDGRLTPRLGFWLGMAAYRLEFPGAVVRRRDLNLSVTLGLRVPVAPGLAVEFGATYAHNDGATRAYTYDRVTGATALTWARGF